MHVTLSSSPPSSSEDKDSEAHRRIAKAIINSCFWEESLKSYGTPGDLTPPQKQKNGNLRLLVKYLPDVAKMALDKCMATDGYMEGGCQRGYIVRYLDQEHFIGGKADAITAETKIIIIIMMVIMIPAVIIKFYHFTCRKSYLEQTAGIGISK